MAIHFLEEDRKGSGFNRTDTRRWIHEIIAREGKKPGVINYIFCSDEYLAGVNLQFLKRDYYTDVISFDYSENGVISGDILISIDRVGENALNLGIARMEELKRIMVHGVLHLIGYEDATEELKAGMSCREDLYLGITGNKGK
jgi:probable rRNA maturation factor